jgi:predicted ATPase
MLSPLVGRDEEIDLLLRRWARAKSNDGQVVLVSGEAGIGKSRLAAALEERLRGEPHLRLRYLCSPHHQDSALFPVIDQIGRAAGFARDDPPATRLEKLEALLALLATPHEDAALLADLLSLPVPVTHPPPNLSPQRKKQQTLEALIRLLERSASRQPILMAFEDAHWIDPTSRELLDLLVERLSTLPVLLIVTYRPDFQPSWVGEPQVTMLALNRLDRRARTALVQQIAGGKALPGEVAAQITDRTDGVPLFLEELTKSVLESGLLREAADHYVLERALPTFSIPMTLHDSLMERLDRLASVRWVAQIGAVIGRQFSYGLMAIVCRLSEDELQSALTRLAASELVVQRGTPPDAVYSFKHALVQDAAYENLLRGTRRELHGQIAEALETHSPEIIESQPELLARHYTEAGLVEKSITYWGKAGQRSAGRAAMAEAAAQFQKGLDQLSLLPDTHERQTRELEFWSALGGVLLLLKGNAAAETGNAYARGRALWERVGGPTEFLRLPWGQARFHMFRGELDLALWQAEEILQLGRQRNDQAGLVMGHYSAGYSLMCTGRFASCRSHLEEVLAAGGPESDALLLQQAGFHPKLTSQAIFGTILFYLGYPDQALAQSGAAIDAARRLAHPASLAGSLLFGVKLLSHTGDNATLTEWADQLFTVTAEQGLGFWGAIGSLYRALATVRCGDVAEGMSLLRSGLSAYRATGAVTTLPFYIDFLAEACESAGLIDESFALLDEALEIAERTGERWFAAELHRHKGRLLMRQGDTESAEKAYQTALSIAAEQEAKLWELRATVDLARLRRDQDRRAEAHDLLAPIYCWFTEGFATPDLKEAKAVLDELS